MAELIDQDIEAKKNKRGAYTSSEINRQTKTWISTWKKIQDEEDDLTNFLNPIFDLQNLNIVLTGAGSSAFIGNVVSTKWQQCSSHTARAIPTTDLVTHFEDHISAQTPLLLISFARSGNSPESSEAIRLANDICRSVHHLIITCNPKGKLARMKDQDKTSVFLLPGEAEDQSLAMTNSFTSMALAATLIPAVATEKKDGLDRQVGLLADYGEQILSNHSPVLKEVAQLDFNRIVFLGSGPLWGTARESHLKVQELTNGDVIGKYDSFLGFRHGPKAIINDKTLIVYLLSTNKQINQYEKDLIEQIAQHDIDLATVAISETNCISSDINFSISLAEKRKLAEEFWAILSTLPAQIIGFYKSLALGYNPDNPSPDGTISRVVEGVNIYNDSTNR